MSKSKQSLLEKEHARIQNSVQDRNSFIGRNASLHYIALWGAYPIAAIFSAFTQGAALNVYLGSIINNPALALTITVLVAITIELAKYLFGNAVSEDARQKAWAESGNHKLAFVLKSAAFVGVMFFSITLSLSGSSDAVKDYRETTTPVDLQLVNLDSINAYYLAQITEERSDIARGEKMQWRGAIIADGRNIIKTAKANIADYETNRQTAISQAEATNQEIIKEYNGQTVKASSWVWAGAGMGELAALLILLLTSNYQDGATKEVLSTAPAPATNGQTTAAVTTIPTNQAFSQNSVQNPNRRPIGFEIPNGGYYNSEPDNTGKGAVKIGHCLHCGEDYEQTVWNKKFCSDRCRMEYHAEKNGGQRFNPKRYHAKK